MSVNHHTLGTAHSLLTHLTYLRPVTTAFIPKALGMNNRQMTLLNGGNLTAMANQIGHEKGLPTSQSATQKHVSISIKCLKTLRSLKDQKFKDQKLKNYTKILEGAERRQANESP